MKSPKAELSRDMLGAMPIAQAPRRRRAHDEASRYRIDDARRVSG